MRLNVSILQATVEYPHVVVHSGSCLELALQHSQHRRGMVRSSAKSSKPAAAKRATKAPAKATKAPAKKAARAKRSA